MGRGADRGWKRGAEEGSTDRRGGDHGGRAREVGWRDLRLGFPRCVEKFGAFRGGLWWEVIGVFTFAVLVLGVGGPRGDFAREDVSNFVVLLVFLG